MKNLVSIVLILVGIGLGFAGFTKLDDSQSSIEIGDLEISAGDQSSSNTAYVMMGIGALCLIGGVVSLSKK